MRQAEEIKHDAGKGHKRAVDAEQAEKDVGKAAKRKFDDPGYYAK